MFVESISTGNGIEPQNIFGALLALLLSQSPGGVPYSSFRTQEAIVSALVAHYSGIMGVTERTLNGKFALARRRMREAATETAQK